MPIVIESTTDTPEQITAAMGDKQEAVNSEEQTQETQEESQESVQENTSESTENQEDENETEESETSEEESEEETEEKEDKKNRPKKGVEKRISKLVKQRREKEQEAEYWKRKAMKNREQPETKETQKLEVTPEGKPEKPNPDNFETHEEYEDARDEYYEKLSDWKVDQKLKAKEQESAERELKAKAKEKETRLVKSVQAFSETVEDYDDVIAEIEDILMPIIVQQALDESENPARLIYTLGKDPEEFERICKMGIAEAAFHIGKVEASFKKSESPSKEEKPKTKTTNAPDPIKPIGGSLTTATEKSLDDPNLSQAEYERIRRKQMEKKRA